VHCPVLSGHQEGAEKSKAAKNQAAVVACGDFVSPATSNPSLPGSRHLKGWFSL
jgi:hypothetical protein